MRVNAPNTTNLILYVHQGLNGLPPTNDLNRRPRHLKLPRGHKIITKKVKRVIKRLGRGNTIKRISRSLLTIGTAMIMITRRNKFNRPKQNANRNTVKGGFHRLNSINQIITMTTNFGRHLSRETVNVKIFLSRDLRRHRRTV